ncbi:MAG TPA: hypothetical protein VEW91_07450 [bacterium]|nr:hypothetical protein [bacterium]
MDLFTRQRVPSTARVTPVLRVLETSQLLLHEDPDLERVKRLAEAFRRDGALRNPPIVTPLDLPRPATQAGEGAAPMVVLDGANRVTALREIGVPHVAVQVVQYERPEIVVSTWRHYVVEAEGPPLRERIADRLGIGVAPLAGSAEAEDRLGRREGVAALVDGRGVALVGQGADPNAHAGLLSGLVGLYQGTDALYRIDREDLKALRAEHGRGTLVIFPPLGKADILQLATTGGRLPAGVTRHLVPGRVLRLNVPLEWLQRSEPTAAKQRRLDAAVEERWRAHGIRYYAEATYLFDE